MARALIVGCGCRGRELGEALREGGWVVRGTTRSAAGVGPIEAAGIEAVVADPDRIATILDAIEGVTLIFWLLGSARGEPDAVGALHGPRLERLLEEIVDTPVRGFVYEVTGELGPEHLVGALEALRSAGERWRIPFEVVDADPARHELWLEGMLASAGELTGPT
jgi:nucleoside-diphosphate-sugar epimerase